MNTIKSFSVSKNQEILLKNEMKSGIDEASPLRWRMKEYLGRASRFRNNKTFYHNPMS